MPAQPTTPIVTKTTPNDGWSAATIAISSSSVGNASVTSASRITSSSTQLAVESGDQSERHAERQRDALRDDADRERDARAVDESRPHVASLNVRAEPVLGGRWTQLVDEIDAHRIVARDERRRDREQDEEEHDTGAEPGAWIAS